MEGPLALFAAKMVEHLDSRGYAPETAIRKMRLVGKLSQFLQQTGRAASDLRIATLEEFASEVELAPSDRIGCGSPGVTEIRQLLE